MATKTLIMFMGTDPEVYEIGRVFRDLGFNYGEPSAGLLKYPERARFPDPAFLWYWNAVRRFFHDMGLPPIAEVPDDILGAEERRYYQTLFARTLMQSLAKGSFICADHLTALVLPMVMQSLGLLEELGIRWRLYFFCSNPERNIGALLRKNGAPVRLGEFIWRNTLTAAMRTAPKTMRIVRLEELDRIHSNALVAEIAAEYGHEGDLPQIDPFLPHVLPSQPLSLSLLTWCLYDALEKGETTEIERAATEAWRAQREQNGWQYVDCLEWRPDGRENLVDANNFCGGSCARARPDMGADGGLMPNTENGETNKANDQAACADNEAWLEILDMAERSSLNARNEYALKLFWNTDSLGRAYKGIADNLRSLDHAWHDRTKKAD